MSIFTRPDVQEAVGLCVAIGALRDLVNHSLMDFRHLSESPGETEVVFKSSPHRDLFYIRLLDFVLEKGGGDLFGEARSCLTVLERTGANPLLSAPMHAQGLSEAASALRAWLDHVINPRLWLSSVGISVRLSVSRIALLRIIGNQAKHNAGRLTGVSKDVQRLLSDQGHSVSLAQIPFVLEDFRDHLGENIFIYYGTWIAQLVNDLAWAIHHYIEPVYRERIVKVDGALPGMYRFDPLPGVSPGSPEHMWFHKLLNEARTLPYVQPFRTPSYLKKKCSLEWESGGAA